jgi:hypothetical protein
MQDSHNTRLQTSAKPLSAFEIRHLNVAAESVSWPSIHDRKAAAEIRTERPILTTPGSSPRWAIW